ncbi:MAG: transposase [Tannerella sp.]|nr:transposase [Tannerella sp.]
MVHPKNSFEQLFVDGIHVITRLRKNMENALMHIHDKIILRKKSYY